MNNIEELYKLGINKITLTKIEYITFLKLITSKDIILKADNLMNYLEIDSNGRYFLSIFIIKYFPNETFEFDNDIKSELLKLTDTIIDFFYNYEINNKNILKINIESFIEIFNIWKKNDNISLKKILTETLVNINISKKKILENNTYDNLTNLEQIIINNYNKQQINLKKKIKFLDKN